MKRTSLMRYGTLKSMFMYALPCFCFLRIWSIINLLSVDGEARARCSSKHQSGKCEEARLCSKGAVGVRGCKVAPLVGRVPRESAQPTRSAVLIPPKVFLFADGALCSLFGDRCDRSDLSQIYIDMVILHFICRHLPMWHMQSAHVC